MKGQKGYLNIDSELRPKSLCKQKAWVASLCGEDDRVMRIMTFCSALNQIARHKHPIRHKSQSSKFCIFYSNNKKTKNSGLA